MRKNGRVKLKPNGQGLFIAERSQKNATLGEALKSYGREASSSRRIRGTDLAAYREKRRKEVSGSAVRHALSLIAHFFTNADKDMGNSVDWNDSIRRAGSGSRPRASGTLAGTQIFPGPERGEPAVFLSGFTESGVFRPGKKHGTGFL